jgi:hypothetical protein
MLRTALCSLFIAVTAIPVVAQVAAPSGSSASGGYGAGWAWAPGTQGPVMSRRAVMPGVQARPDQVRVGYKVYSTEGPLIGRVAYADSSVAVVRSPHYALRLPLKAFGVKKSGLLLPLSPKNFDSLARLHGARAS